MYEKFVRERITQLRLAKNVSERSMSLDLGHSTSYIHSIASGKALPSLAEFFYICAYFEITPREFFEGSDQELGLLGSIFDDLRAVPKEQLFHLAPIIKALRNQ